MPPLLRPPLRNKVPPVTAAFWAIKILSTTVGETIADTLAVDLEFGTVVTTIGMAVLLAVALQAQLRARRCVPALYWTTVVLVSIVGTQLTDLLTDDLGLSLWISTGGFALLLVALFEAWYHAEGTLDIATIDAPRREAFYWSVILCTFALGTAAGDLATEALALGFRWGVAVFGGALLAIALLWRLGPDRLVAFWLAYILTRPLGAALGDLLAQSPTYGGLGLGALATSVVFLVLIAALVVRASLGEPMSPSRSPSP